MITALFVAVAQLSISVSARDTVEGDETFVVSVVVHSPSLLPPTVVPPAFEGFVLQRTSAVTRSAREGPATRAVLSIDYHLMAPSAGSYVIRPFEARLEGTAARSDPLTVVVRRRGSSGVSRVPTVVRVSQINAARAVNVAVLGTPDTVYVGEQATYEVAVFIDEELLRQRPARNPTFTPPDLRGTLSYELPTSTAPIPSRPVGERVFRPHVYQRAIFPLVAGRHVVPAVTLDYTLPPAGGFYGREETHTLRADSVVIVARPLPDEGRPAGFAGAVGSLDIERILSSYRLRVGDPVTIRARVSGVGNVKLLPRPLLEISWADVLDAGERVETSVVDGNVGGVKEFTWIVTPKEGGTQEIPAISYPFFDPRARRYQVAATLGEFVEIVGSSVAPISENVSAAPTSRPIRTVLRDDARPFPTAGGTVLFATLVLLAPFPALLVLMSRRRREALVKAGAAPDVRGQPLGVVAPFATLAAARRELLNAVERRLNLPHGITADERGFRRALLHAGVTRESADNMQKVVAQLDARIFGDAVDSDPALERKAAECFARVDAEATK